jgi:hypothetical protein
MDATNNIATDLFYKVRSRFKGLKLGNEMGQITINPEEARFFDFDYMAGEKAIGHVSISLAESNSLKVYFSTGISESMDTVQKNHWYGFLKELRTFAKRRLMSFDTRDIAKDNLDRRDYEFLTQHNQPKQQPNAVIQTVGESIMNVNESTMYGSRNVSYQKLMDTRLIIKHSQAVMDDTQPGARTRNISALFVENQDGERFKYPFIHLSGARAMQRHVANGGVPYDDVGKSIINMSENIAQLKSFNNYVVRNDLMNFETNNIVERSHQQLNDLREQLARLGKQSHYEAYKENFTPQEQYEIPEEVVEDYTEKFTVRNFKEDIKNVFPVLYRLMKESEIGYDDIVAMTQGQEQLANEDLEVELEDSPTAFDKFENWVMALGEDSAVTSQDPEEQSQAVKELQELVGQHFSAGVDGSNAIESLKGLIEDPQLYRDIKETAKADPDSDVRAIVKDWIDANAPELVEELDFGDYAVDPEEGDAPAAAQGGDQTAPEAPQQEADQGPNKSDVPAFMRKAKGNDDWKMSTKDLDDEKTKSPTSSAGLARKKKELGMEDQQQQSMKIQELAEFIHSFYDRESGTFPKGPEGVSIMVGKKYGPQAESVARKMVERMAPQQQDPAVNELARIKELSQW